MERLRSATMPKLDTDKDRYLSYDKTPLGSCWEETDPSKNHFI